MIFLKKLLIIGIALAGISHDGSAMDKKIKELEDQVGQMQAIVVIGVKQVKEIAKSVVEICLSKNAPIACGKLGSFLTNIGQLDGQLDCYLYSCAGGCLGCCAGSCCCIASNTIDACSNVCCPSHILRAICIEEDKKCLLAKRSCHILAPFYLAPIGAIAGCCVWACFKIKQSDI